MHIAPFLLGVLPVKQEPYNDTITISVIFVAQLYQQ